MQNHYSEEEASAILRKAVERQPMGDEMSRAQLESIATEMGITPDALASAEAAWRAEREQHALRASFDAERRSAFRTHLISYLAVNTFLLLLNLFVSPGFLWVVFPALGWGLGLFFHAVQCYQSGPEADRAFEEWLEKRAHPRFPRVPPDALSAAPEPQRRD
jgi:hypothetical protein